MRREAIEVGLLVVVDIEHENVEIIIRFHDHLKENPIPAIIHRKGFLRKIISRSWVLVHLLENIETPLNCF